MKVEDLKNYSLFHCISKSIHDGFALAVLGHAEHISKALWIDLREKTQSICYGIYLPSWFIDMSQDL